MLVLAGRASEQAARPRLANCRGTACRRERVEDVGGKDSADPAREGAGGQPMVPPMRVPWASSFGACYFEGRIQRFARLVP
jgi:hypothetical protein